jgi:hypothetical protein
MKYLFHRAEMEGPQKNANANFPLQDPGELFGSVLGGERDISQEAAEKNRIQEFRHISLYHQLFAGHHL